MPSTKTNNKPGAKKGDDAKPSKAAAAPKTAAKATADASTRSLDDPRSRT